ncbi:hypothetical protein P171DRAFT_445018 [Karstenula rhodostoma CBS 690.94]|uniref:Uncharacterized protein n=1 Tax=Karstenula rhodostoma CBS 690.94 TaxID=1392251 RepID=A0A9P4UB12_9PLEO|nr:hypothetical protein P171DRAFT_445018 [Karstenula rhodostoma CBS 690.94]
MAEVPKLTLLSVASGDIAYPVTNEDGDNTEEQVPDSRKTRSRTPSPPVPLFTFSKSDSRTTWHRQATREQSYIQLVVEREGFPHGAVIADRLDPHLLFKVAPALQKRLEGRRIYVPRASCLDEETVESMVFGLLRCAGEGIPVPEPVDKKPVTMIRMHCVLVFFEMQKEAQDLEAKLWDSFQQVKLTPMDVLWIWDTFSGRIQSEPYTAPFAHQYVQMMAWQILNLDAVGMLNQDIRHLIELEKEPKYFTEAIGSRFKTHGLGKDPLVPETKTNVPVVTQTTKTETSRHTAKDTVGGQKNKSEPAVAKHVVQASTNEKPKFDNSTLITSTPGTKAPAFKSAGLTDVFTPPPPPPTPFGAPDPSTTKALPAGPKFDFARVLKNIRADSEAASQTTAKAVVKQPGMFTGIAEEEKQKKMGSNAQNSAAVPNGFNHQFGGAKASRSLEPNTTTLPPFSSSGFGVGAPSQPHFGGFGQPPTSAPIQAPTQPTASTNTVGFAWGAPGATQPTTSAPSQPTVGLRASAGSTFNLFGGANTSNTSTPTPSTQVPATNTGFNIFRTPQTSFQTSASTQAPLLDTGFNAFGGAAAASTGTPQGQFPNAGTAFSNSTSNVPFTGMFGAEGSNSSNNAGAFGAPTNNFVPFTPDTSAPVNTGFHTNTNFGGQAQPNGFGGQSQPQPSNGSPFGNPFGNSANNTGAGNNMFAFQGTSGGNAGATKSGATGGGMVRKIVKPTGAKRRR